MIFHWSVGSAQMKLAFWGHVEKAELMSSLCCICKEKGGIQGTNPTDKTQPHTELAPAESRAWLQSLEWSRCEPYKNRWAALLSKIWSGSPQDRTSTHQFSSNITFLAFWVWGNSRTGLPVRNCLNWSDFWHSYLAGDWQFNYRCLKSALFGSFWTKMNAPSGKFTWPSALVLWKAANQLSLLPSMGKLKILPLFYPSSLSRAEDFSCSMKSSVWVF